MNICAVQCRAVPGDIAANLERHLMFVTRASELGADLVFFPELSITGYEPRLARSLALSLNDSRLDVLQESSDRYGITIGVGAPHAESPGKIPSIAMFWFSPTQPRRVYAKQHLHEDELRWFDSGEQPCVLDCDSRRIATAICYESVLDQHAEQALEHGANVYLVSVAKPAHAIERAHAHYSGIARRHGMQVVLANAIGPSDNFISAGRSAAWDVGGDCLGEINGGEEGLVVFDSGNDLMRVMLGGPDS